MNSSIEIAEAVKLAKKLIDRTREGRLPWEADGILKNFAGTTDLSGATAFTTTLESNLRATVSYRQSAQTTALEQRGQLTFSLVEFDPRWVDQINALAAGKPLAPDKVILSVSVEKDPSFGYDTADEMHLNGLLVDLYELARRSALKIDGSVEKALSYLDRIAV